MFDGGGRHGVAVHPALDVRSESSRCTVKNDPTRPVASLRRAPSANKLVDSMEAGAREGLKQTVKRCRSGWPMLGCSATMILAGRIASVFF